MDLQLLFEAIVSGVLLGCFYAAVSLGLSIAFGLLDVPHIAHPAFLVLGAFGAYVLGGYGLDPLVAGLLLMPVFFVFGLGVYQFYYATFERRGTDTGLRGLAFFFGVAFIVEVGLILAFGVDQRMVEAPYIGTQPRNRRDAPALPHAGRVRNGRGPHGRAQRLPLAHLHRPRHQGGGAGRGGAAADGRRPRARQADCVRHCDRGDRGDRRAPHHRRAGRTRARPHLHRTHVLRRGAGGPGQRARAPSSPG